MKKHLILLKVFIPVIILGMTLKNSSFHNNINPLYTSAPAELIKLTEVLGKENQKSPDYIRIMTYNLLADSIGFDGTTAYKRADGVCRLINEIKPDIIGLQETSRNWRMSIRDNTEYVFLHSALTDIQDSMTCIIYNPQSLTLLKSGEYVFNYGSDSRLRKMVWGIFSQNTTGKFFIVTNTHFSLSSTNNIISMNQAEELLNFCKFLKENYNCPIFFIGDFNARERNKKAKLSSPVYENLCTVLEDTKNVSESISAGEHHSAYASSNDHIFIKGDASIKKYVILSQKNMTLLSDHYPIFIDTVI